MATTRWGSSKAKPPEEIDLDITPMIDVTFLLLIFFMVTSNMKNTSTLQVPPAKYGQGIPVDQSNVISIFNTDGNPEIFLSDAKRENGPVDTAAVTAFVREGSASGKHNVIIKADRDLPAGFVQEVARAANDVDTELKFYIGVMDKPR